MADVTVVTTEDQEAYLRDWASRHKVIYDDEGVCGFGRECVGISSGNGWVDLGPTHHVDSNYGGYDDISVAGGAYPPEGVEDAYHKHDCLAVLGRGPLAISQLYLWVKNIEAHGLVVKHTPRDPKDMLDALFHGLEYVHLAEPS